MNENRREFLRSGMVTALSVAAASGVGGDRAQPTGSTGAAPSVVRRPVLYNADSDIYYNLCPPVVDRTYFEGIVNQLADSKVTIFSQCVYLGGEMTDRKVSSEQIPQHGGWRARAKLQLTRQTLSYDLSRNHRSCFPIEVRK